MRRAPITSSLTLRPIPPAVPGLVPVDLVTRLASIPRDRQRYHRSSRSPAVLYPPLTFSNGGRTLRPNLGAATINFAHLSRVCIKNFNWALTLCSRRWLRWEWLSSQECRHGELAFQSG